MAEGPPDPQREAEPQQPGVGVVAREVRGRLSWLDIDREADPVADCLEAAIDCLAQLRERVPDADLAQMADVSPLEE